MALEKQTLPISLGTGMDTKTDDKQVVPGKFLYLKNATLQETGKLKKRNGYGVIASASNGNALASFKDELLVLDGSTIQSYSDFDGTLYSKGQKIACSLTVKSVVSNTYEQTNADSAIHSSGFRVFAWDDSSGGVRYSVFDSETGQAIVSAAEVFASGSMAKVKAIGNYVVIFYNDASATPGVLKYKAISASTPTVLGSAVTVGTLTQDCYDVALVGTALVITYSDSGAKASLKSLSSTLTLSSAYQVNVNVAYVSVFGDASNQPWVIYNQQTTGTVGYFIVNAGLSSLILAATTIQASTDPRNVTGYISGSGAVAVWESAATDASDYLIRKAALTSGGAVSSNSVLLRSVGLFTKPFAYGSKHYLGVTHESELQSSYFVIDESAKVVAKIAPSSGGGLRSDRLLAEVNADGSDSFQFAYLIKDFVTSVNGDVTTQTGVNEGAIQFDTPITSVSVGDNLIISGAVVSGYDGSSITEYGFHLYPEGATVEKVSGGGGVGTGTYQSKFIYEWIDNQGQIQRSAPSIGVETDTAADLVYLSASGSGGSGQISVSGTDAFKMTFGAISGTGMSGGTYVVNNSSLFSQNQMALSQPTSGAASGTYSITPGYSLRGASVTGSKVFTLTRPVAYWKKCDISIGSNSIYVNDPTGLRVGMTVIIDPVTPTGVYITAIAGNTVTLSGNAAHTVSDATLYFTFEYRFNCTNGSSVLTSTFNATNIRVGDIITSFSNATVISVVGTAVTVSTPATFTASNTGTSVYLDYEYPSVGQSFTVISGASFSGTVAVESTGTGTVTFDQQATATTATVYLNSSEVYSLSCTVPTLRITEKYGTSPVSIVHYRTEVNGTVFYRASSIDAPTYNDTTTDSVTFTDMLNDESLIGNELLYTTGDVVENIAPPASDSIFTYKKRVMLIPSENSSNAWYSKVLINGTPVEFNDAFFMSVPEQNGGLTTGGQLDDKLVLFKRNLPFIVFGDGPNDTGAQNDFSEPQAIPADVGCVDKKSVVQTPFGLMFKSSKGIYLLDRSLQVTYIGAEVEDYNSYSVTSARKMETVNQIRFGLSGQTTALVYDYFAKQWSVFENVGAKDALIYSGNYTYINSSGSVYTETPGTFLDGSSFIPLGFITSWLQLAGIQGLQRTYQAMLLGDYVSPHTLTISVAYDFETSYTQSVTIPVTSSPSGQYQYRAKFNRQKSEAIQLRFEETQTVPFGEGLSMSTLAIEAGVKKGQTKKGGGRTYG